MKLEHFETNLKKENEFPKLVRDKIPEIILNKEGRRIKTIILNKDIDYLRFLLKKIEEEANEVANAKNKKHLAEELCDVMEIIDEILKLNNWSLDQIRGIQDEKREERGGFKKRIVSLGN